MAQIDALLDHMRNTGVVHAVLRGDSPSHLENANGVSQGNVVSNAMLEDMFLEIASDAACQTMQDSGVGAFRYNDFDFYVTIEDEHLNFAISPADAVYVASPVVPAPPATTAVVPVPAALVPDMPAPLTENEWKDESTLPTEARGFNWGAFLLTWIWSIGNRTWIGLLCLVPVVGFFMRFVLGFKGNEMAWRNRRFASLDEFKSVQKSWATAGLILVLISFCTLPFTAAVLFPVFGRARENAKRANCQSNLRMIALGVRKYAQAHGDQLPTSLTNEQFKQDLQRYVSSTAFDCPSDVAKGASDYVYNPRIASKSLSNLPEPSRFAMLWDKPGLNHLGGRNIAFADGHVKWYREDVAQEWIDYEP